MTRILDYTSIQPNPPPPVIRVRHGVREEIVKHLIRRGKVVERSPRDVDMVVLHQTACVFGNPDHRDPDGRYRRAMNVACHVLAFRDGVIAFPNPLPWYVYHGNKFNKRSLGEEIEGHFPGLPDDPSTPRREDIQSTWGNEPTPLTPEGLEAAREGLRLLVYKAKAWGADVKYLAAHRQSSKTRQSDPGWEPWQKVAVEFGERVMGLTLVPDLVVGDGRPIPRAWDPHQGDRY